MKKRIITILLTVCMITALLPLGITNANAASTSFTIRTSKPTTSNKYYISTKNGGLNKCIVIDSSNGFVLPNCVGYAWGRAYEAFGKKPKLSTGNAKNWYSYNKKNGYYTYGSTPKAGSIACWGGGTYGHVAFVEKVEGDNVTITESRYGGKVWYTRTMTKSKMKTFLGYTLQGYIYIDPQAEGTEDKTLSIKYNSNGADIDCKKYITLYDINLRSSYSTSSSKLDLIPKGTTVTVSDIKESGGYKWGKTTYNSKTGWCALADKSEDYAYKRFYLDDSGTVFLTKDKSALVHKMTGKTADDLYNYTNFGLKMDGYRFAGWCADPNGNDIIFDQDDDTLTAEKICKEVVEKDKTITLYAIWDKTIKPVKCISIASEPDKTQYFTGDKFDPEGMSLKVEYDDGTSSVITEGFNYDCDLFAYGTVIVSVEYEGAYDFVEVNVTEPVTDIVEENVTLDIGGLRKLNAATSAKAQMNFYSLDDSVASVDADGIVTGLANGITLITAEIEYNNITYSDTCTVVVGTGIKSGSETYETEPDETDNDATDTYNTQPDESEPGITEPDEPDTEENEPDITGSDMTNTEENEPDTTESGETEFDETEPDETEPEETDAEETEPDDPVTDPNEPDEVIKGDINSDGDANNKDVVALFRYVSVKDNDENDPRYDFNEDGYVDNKDVVALFRYLSE